MKPIEIIKVALCGLLGSVTIIMLAMSAYLIGWLLGAWG